MIKAPEGWTILPEGAKVPTAHREYLVEPDGTTHWGRERGLSTMTPIFAPSPAKPWGWVHAIAVKDDNEREQALQ